MTIEIELYGVLCVFFFNFTFGFHGFHLKKLKIIQYNFWTGAGKKIGKYPRARERKDLMDYDGW